MAMIEVKEQCKSCFHFQVCANVLKQQLYIREKMLNEENPKCEHYTPTADVVEVKHGYWKYSHKENVATCSVCGYDHYLGTYHQYATNGCPNCLAKMDGKT